MKYLILILMIVSCGPATTFEYIPLSTTTTTTPVPVFPEYLGCYTDTSARALPKQLTLAQVTVETCTTAAKQAGYKYAGLQYGTQCFVGATIGFYKDSETACNYSCNANYTEWCGGAWHNSIWQVSQ